MRRWSLRGLAVVAVIGTQVATGQVLRLVSLPNSPEGPPASAGGDSYAPIVSRDGRFVLFASSANNLVTGSNNAALLPRQPPNLNVFLRDRVNGTTTLVSVNALGTGTGNGDSLPVNVSTNGRYALFESSASDLVPGDTNKTTDIFLRDLQAGTTLLVSANTNGVAGNGESRNPVMTPDARYVVFTSAANDLVPADTNRIADVFVRDMQSGITTLVSVGAVSTNTTTLMGASEGAGLTPDGRYVVFSSTATNLVADAPPGGDVYVRDLVGGTTTWASAEARALAQGLLNVSNAVSYTPVLSDDGQYVAFETSWPDGASTGLILRYNVATASTDVVHTNATVGAGLGEEIRSLEMTPDGRFISFIANTNDTATTCVQLWDAQTGVSSLVSGDVAANQVAPGTICAWPTLDPSGRFVAFLSSANILNSNNFPAGYHLYLWDMVGGPVLINAGTNGVAVPVNSSARPSLSADGSVIAYECGNGGLVPNDRNRASDVFVRNFQTGATELISGHHPLLPTVTPNGLTSLRPGCSSGDGRYIVFTSDADNLIAGDTNNCRDVFFRDRFLGTNLLISVATNGTGGDGFSMEPVISSDGHYVAFTSTADNLVPNDTNNFPDVFLRDVQAGTTVLVSQNSAGNGSGNGLSFSPVLSRDGQYVMFYSKAANLIDPPTTGSQNLFLRDLHAGVTYALSTNGIVLGAAAMTPDGHFVSLSVSGQIYIWSSLEHRRVYTNNPPSQYALNGLSPDGTKLVHLELAATPGVALYAADWIGHTNWLVATGVVSSIHFAFSPTGQFLAYTFKKAVAATNQVYLFDFQSATSVLVSHAPEAPATPGNAISDWPTVSPDGRFVAYRSAADNLVVGDTNNLPDVFLYDRLTGSNTLVTTTQSGGASGNLGSFAPIFSEDGHVLFFESGASDLVASDFNESSDLFAYGLLLVTLSQPDPSQGITISWPYDAALTYSVEFRDSLAEPAWQHLNGTITNTNGTAWMQDNTPGTGQRFYRVGAH